MTRTVSSDGSTVTIAIATTGRRGIVAQTIAHLAGQADHADKVVVSIVHTEDLDRMALPPLPFPLEVVTGPKGSCVQRNAVLSLDDPGDIILFLDDDFLIAEGHISAVRRLFSLHPDVVMSTGKVLADGIHGPGFSHREGTVVLAQAPQTPSLPCIEDIFSVYGCNMAIRTSALAQRPERFDEALPLYGWLEDMDLSRRMARHGRVVRDTSLLGVHLGTKVGRSPGRLLGYSQVANPVYMIRKGTVPATPVLRIMAGNILANLGRSVRPEPWIDRRGRLRGNLMALADLLRGRCAPGRVLDLGRPSFPGKPTQGRRQG